MARLRQAYSYPLATPGGQLRRQRRRGPWASCGGLGRGSRRRALHRSNYNNISLHHDEQLVVITTPFPSGPVRP
eukprot:scaffold36407_cov28-Tisochrysis_lutea.AAC.1